MRQFSANMSRSHPRPPANRLPAWVNARRALHVERLVGFLRDRGGKIVLNRTGLAAVRAEIGLEQWQLEKTIDDAFVLKLVDVRLAGGDTSIVTLLEAGR